MRIKTLYIFTRYKFNGGKRGEERDAKGGKKRNAGRQGKEIFTAMYNGCYTMDITCHNISDCAEAPRYGKFMKITALRSPRVTFAKISSDTFNGSYRVFYTRDHFAGRTRAISIKLNSN